MIRVYKKGRTQCVNINIGLRSLTEVYLCEVVLSIVRHLCDDCLILTVVSSRGWIDVQIGGWRGGGQLSPLHPVSVSGGWDDSQAGHLGLAATLDGHCTLTHTALPPGD